MKKSIITKLPPQVSRIIFVQNLPYKISAEQLYDIFNKFGSIRQIRKGTNGRKKGTAFVVYQDIYDAKNALESLNGFNVAGRYLTAIYYTKTRNKLQNKQ